MIRPRISRTTAKLLILILLSAFSPLIAESGTPEKSVRDLLGKIQQIHTGEELSSQQIEANQKLYEDAVVHLDVLRVSQKTLGKHWGKIDTGKQNEFVDLLRNLFMHVAFQNSAKFFRNMKIEYQESRIKKNKARVPLKVHHEDEGEVEIDFVLRQNSAAWKVTDVILDGVSMRNNLRTQFQKILKKNDFSDLIRRMNKKLKKSKKG